MLKRRSRGSVKSNNCSFLIVQIGYCTEDEGFFVDVFPVQTLKLRVHEAPMINIIFCTALTLVDVVWRYGGLLRLCLYVDSISCM